MQLPAGLTTEAQAFPVIFIDTADLDSTQPDHRRSMNMVIYQAMHRVHPGDVSGQTLLKIHLGEPKCATRLKPEYVLGSIRFLQDHGASGIVAGDTTVAYSGPRGHKQNPPGDVSSYLELAQVHGWAVNGVSGIPYVALDRPCSAIPGVFEFDEAQSQIELRDIQRFKDFYPAGGFSAADFVINHAHLTLHGLAGLAGCVKSIAMGCSALKGKLRMHQSLLPHFSAELCATCGRCVESCPEGALKFSDEEGPPVVDPELCIGCGECEAVCPKRVVTLRGEAITDWKRGEDTLPLRMADCLMGLMDGRWEHTIHVLHMVAITERCDCVNIRQKPMLKRDLGFLVGKNPFAIDQLAGRMLADALREEGRKVDKSLLKTAETTAKYVQETYGILTETPFEHIVLSYKGENDVRKTT